MICREGQIVRIKKEGYEKLSSHNYYYMHDETFNKEGDFINKSEWRTFLKNKFTVVGENVNGQPGYTIVCEFVNHVSETGRLAFNPDMLEGALSSDIELLTNSLDEISNILNKKINDKEGI